MTVRKRVPSLADLRMGRGRPKESHFIIPTQKELAETVQVTQAHVSQIESGYAKPSQYLLARLAAYYGMDLDDIRKAARETQRRRASGEPQLEI